MKLFTTPALKYDAKINNAFVAKPLPGPEDYEFKWWFCITGILKLFDLPEDTVKTIWLEFHDRPADDRVSYQITEEHTTDEDSFVVIDGDTVVVSGYTARLIEKRLGSSRRLCYVGCYYKD